MHRVNIGIVYIGRVYIGRVYIGRLCPNSSGPTDPPPPKLNKSVLY